MYFYIFKIIAAGGQSQGAIIGGSLISIIVLLVIAGVLAKIYKRQKQKKTRNEASPQAPSVTIEYLHQNEYYDNSEGEYSKTN